MEIIKFGQDDIANVLSSMTDHQINDLAFGAVELDAQGKVLRYNVTEGQITGREPEAVVGQNFFRAVAPCTNTPQFKGAFDELVAGRKNNVMFDYTFDYQMQPTRVKVHMMKALRGDNFWVFVKRV